MKEETQSESVEEGIESRGFRERLLAVKDGELAANPYVFLPVCLILSLLVSLLLSWQFADIYGNHYTFAIPFVLTAAVLVNFHWNSIRSAIRITSPYTWRPHPGWLLVGVAIALRYVLLEYLPPPIPIFEEVQTGKNANDIMHHSILTLEFRLTNMMAAAGLTLGSATLESLRMVFMLASSAAILVVALTLRRLSVGWPATLLAVFTMASLRFFVLGGATAEEIFGGIIFEALLFYCVACSCTSRDNEFLWAGFAGIFGGVLMYEYIPYKLALIIPPAYWFLQGFVVKEKAIRRRALLAGGLYVLCLSVIAAPVISQAITSPTDNFLMEPLVRHMQDGQPSPLADAGELRVSLERSGDYASILLGQTLQTVPKYHIVGDPVIPGIVGVLFGLSLLYSLWRPVFPIMRVAAVLTIAYVIGYGFVVHNWNPGTLIPAALLLILLMGISADALVRRFQPEGGFHLSSIRRNPVIYLFILTIIIVAINAVGVVRMSASEPTLREYQNTQYYICLAIAEAYGEFEFDRVHAQSNFHCNKGDDIWLYPDIAVDILNDGGLPHAADIEPATLVVVGHSHGLDDALRNEFAAQSVNAGSAHTLRTRNNLLGDVAAMSFCHQCPPAPDN